MKKLILTESDKKVIISAKEKAIIETFAKTFNKIKRIDEYFQDSDSLPNQKMIDWVKNILYNSSPIELSASFRGMGNEKPIKNIMNDFFKHFEKDLDGLSHTDKYNIYLSIRQILK